MPVIRQRATNSPQNSTSRVLSNTPELFSESGREGWPKAMLGWGVRSKILGVKNDIMSFLVRSGICHHNTFGIVPIDDGQ